MSTQKLSPGATVIACIASSKVRTYIQQSSSQCQPSPSPVCSSAAAPPRLTRVPAEEVVMPCTGARNGAPSNFSPWRRWLPIANAATRRCILIARDPPSADFRCEVGKSSRLLLLGGVQGTYEVQVLAMVPYTQAEQYLSLSPATRVWHCAPCLLLKNFPPRSNTWLKKYHGYP